MMFPEFRFNSMLNGTYDSHNNRSVFDNRAYGATWNQKNTNLPMRFAPNMHIGHELSLFASLEFENWSVKQNNEAGAEPTEKISPIGVSLIAPGLFLRYAYQFPFTLNFGFFLGTTMGMVFAETGKAQFRGGYGVVFPTIMIGFTGTPVTNDRLMIGAEYSAIWYPEMTVYTNTGSAKPLGAALSAWNFYLENDYFFSDSTAFSVSSGIRIINNICKLSFVCSSSNYLYTMTIENFVYYGQAGFVFDLN